MPHITLSHHMHVRDLGVFFSLRAHFFGFGLAGFPKISLHQGICIFESLLGGLMGMQCVDENWREDDGWMGMNCDDEMSDVHIG